MNEATLTLKHKYKVGDTVWFRDGEYDELSVKGVVADIDWLTVSISDVGGSLVPWYSIKPLPPIKYNPDNRIVFEANVYRTKRECQGYLLK